MEPLAILRSDPLDLLFENRNKSYGAYPLRKYYAQRLYMSLGIVLSGVVAVSFFYLHFHTGTQKKKRMMYQDVVLSTVDLIPPDKPVLPQTRPFIPRPPASVEWLTPLITRDREISRPMTNIEDLGNHPIGLAPTPGDPAGEQWPVEGNSEAPAGKGADSANAVPQILERAEFMPEFPGGQEALRRFLQKNLRMPENNLDYGTEVKVVARFVVGGDGKVRDIEITKAADEVFNQEVKRVILKMPDWKPGMQHNRKVAVYFNLPVNFLIEE